MPACSVSDSSADVTNRLSRTMRPSRPSCGSSGTVSTAETSEPTARSAGRGIRSLRDAEAPEAVTLDRVAAQERVALLGIHARCLAEPMRHRPRMRPGAVTVRVVGFEKNRAEADRIATVEAVLVVEDATPHAAAHDLAGRPLQL